MVMMTGIYEGKLHCTLTHGPSETKISTDAPKDNNGLGEAFSPTDLLGAALGSCILTTMAIYGNKSGLDVTGASFIVTKKMQMSPRMVSELTVEITLPDTIAENERAALEDIAHTGPVTRSLNPDIKLPVTFHYKSI